MTAIVSSPRQTRILEITSVCFPIFIMGVGLFYQFMGQKLDGPVLILVGLCIITYANLFRSQLSQASVRVDELEKKLSTYTSLPDA